MALTYQAAVEQTITAGEQIHQIVNGTATTEVTVEDGSKVPSIRKALLDNFYFKDPIAWQVGQTEKVFNQLRKFTDGSWWYAPSATANNPISMGSTPVGDSLWKIYDFDAIGKLNPQIREALRRSYAEAGYNLVDGSFEAGGTLVNVNDVLLQERTGKAFSGPDGTVAAGTNPASGGFVDRSAETLRHKLALNTGAGMVATADGRTVQERFDNIPAEVDASGTAAALISQHDSSPAAHPALSAFISAEANRAEVARDAAFVNANVYPNIASGLAAVAGGEQFQVAEGDSLARYRNDSGTAVEVARYPTAAVQSALQDTLNTVRTETLITLTNIGGTPENITATSPIEPFNGMKFILRLPTDVGELPSLSINGNNPISLRGSNLKPLSVGNLKAGQSYIFTKVSRYIASMVGFNLNELNNTGGPIPDGTSLNELVLNRTYYGDASHTYSFIPPELKGRPFILKCRPLGSGLDVNANRILQEIYPIPDTSVKYSRFLYTPNLPTESKWVVRSFNEYRGSTNNSLDTLFNPGTYVLTTGFTGAPHGYTKTTGLFKVSAYGQSFITQTLTETGDGANVWQRVVRPLSVPVFGEWGRIGGGQEASPSLPLFGKRIVFLGDSQINGMRWPNDVGSRLGADVVNGGFGGTRLSEMTNSLSGQCGVDVAEAISTGDWTVMEAGAETYFQDTGRDNRPVVTLLKAQDWSEVDYIVCHWGTNDWNNSVDLGDEDLTEDRVTIRGSVNYFMSRVSAAYPHITVLWVSPPFRARQTPGDGKDSDSTPNGAGVYLRDLGDAILSQAQEYWSAPTLDMYRRSGINRTNYALYLRDQNVDGLHYYGPGQDRAADRVSGSLRALV